MEGLIPYARGFFYHLPVSISSVQLNTWHHHVYDKPAKTPTPFFISNILNLEQEKKKRADQKESSECLNDSQDRNSLFSNSGFNGRLFSGQPRYPNVVVRAGSPVHQREMEREGTRIRRNTQSPCTFPRDRVESPQEGDYQFHLFSVSSFFYKFCH